MRFYDPVLGEPSSLFNVEEEDENSAVLICLQLILPGPQPTERIVQAFLTAPENYSDTDGSGIEFRSAGNIIPVTDRELPFADGSTNGSLLCTEIEIIGDLVPEPTTFFVAVLRVANSADMIAETNVARIVISDNDDISKLFG